MNFHVVTLFPEMIAQAAAASIFGRAVKNGIIHLNITNIRDFSTNTRMRVDDYPYGGGAGMVMEAEPVFRAVKKAKEAAGGGARVIYLTPQAKVLDQMKVEELAREEDLILLCGHYEGIDERVLEEVVTDYVSIGDYVLTGGELGALVLMDAVSRFVPGVLHNEESSQFESLQDNLLEYPHYTRPEVWHEKQVPEILLSGDHQKIEAWRHEASVRRTAERRPDLLRSSYAVQTVSFGTEDCLDTAAALTGAVSRYGIVLDYNRKKLRKEKRRFSAGDAVLFVTDLEQPNMLEEALPAVLKAMRGSRTPAFFLICPPDGNGTEEGGTDEKTREAVLKEMLANRDLELMTVMVLTERDRAEAFCGAALSIRGTLCARSHAADSGVEKS